MPGLYSRYFVESDGNTILADHWEGELNTIKNAFEPQYMDDMSSDTTAMRASTDPGESGTESLATSLDGEIKRIRKILSELSGKTYWYQSPATSLETLNTNAVVAPSGATDNAIVRFDGTGGKTFQNSVVTIDDAGSIAGITGCDATGARAIKVASTLTAGVTAALGDIAVANSTVSFSSSSTTYVDITNATCTITTHGNPVFLYYVPGNDGGSANSRLYATGGADSFFIKLVRDSTDVSISSYAATADGLSTGPIVLYDKPAAGTYVYKLQAREAAGGSALTVNAVNMKLIAEEKA